MTFGRQPEQNESAGEPTFIYEPSRTLCNVPSWMFYAGLAGMEHLSTPESYPHLSLTHTIGPGLDCFGFGPDVSEFAGPSHSPGEVVLDPLNLHIGARGLDSHEGRKDAPTEPSSLSEPVESRFRALGGESVGRSGYSLTGSDAHQE